MNQIFDHKSLALVPLMIFLLLSGKVFAWDSKSYTPIPKEKLKEVLTHEQFNVTQEEGTEYPFKNAYWNQHEDGIYVDVVSGEPLFSSKDKYESGTGWPSFTKPLVANHIETKRVTKMGVERTEVRSHFAGSHLGHVFDDGPKPTGKRYCMNSASLRFIPASELTAKGYGEFASLFAAPSTQSAPQKTTKTKK